MNNRIVSFTMVILSIIMIAHVLVTARNFLIPIIVAIMIWHLLNTVANGIKNNQTIGSFLPRPLCMLLAIALMLFLFWSLVNIISNNVVQVINESSRYQENFVEIMKKIDAYFHIKLLANVNEYMNNISIQSMLVNVYGMFTSITSNAVIIALYVIFLFFEQHVMEGKLNAFFSQEQHRQLSKNIITQIVQDTQTYLGIKTLMSLLTASSSWVIMKLVGLDFAEFWALLIFFLNYIPNIGSIIATAFPAMLALIQFQSVGPFSVITAGLIVVQFIVGNLIEPKLMGRSLNLSPLVILLALGIWGSLWGVLGMFLSVPITVMSMIIFSHFEKTHGIAVLLSQDGHINRTTTHKNADTSLAS